jgi:hypothetical protein
VSICTWDRSRQIQHRRLPARRRLSIGRSGETDACNVRKWAYARVVTVETIASVVAAVAAVGALYFARDTVREAIEDRNDASKHHEEQIEQLTSLLAATKEAHDEEASDHRRLYDHDLIIRRVAQIQRISETLSALMDAARSEWSNPTPRYDLGNGGMLAATPVMALQTRLRLEVQVLRSLGGPQAIEGWIPPLERDDDGAGLLRLWTSTGLTALQKLQGMLQMYEALQPDSIFDRDHESTRKVPQRLSDGPEKFSP